MYSPTTPLTGGPQTGFTTPAFIHQADVAPDTNGKQNAITGYTGTIAGFRAHTVSDPCTFTFYRPKTPKALPSPNAVTGKYPQVPMNTYGGSVRKGVNFAANNAPAVSVFRYSADIPAGADAYDAPNVRALMSIAAGVIWQQSSGIGDTLVTGLL